VKYDVDVDDEPELVLVLSFIRAGLREEKNSLLHMFSIYVVHVRNHISMMEF